MTEVLLLWGIWLFLGQDNFGRITSGLTLCCSVSEQGHVVVGALMMVIPGSLPCSLGEKSYFLVVCYQQVNLLITLTGDVRISCCCY
jgi:hypothetical protein